MASSSVRTVLGLSRSAHWIARAASLGRPRRIAQVVRELAAEDALHEVRLHRPKEFLDFRDRLAVAEQRVERRRSNCNAPSFLG
jgi:hypothetical protein